MLAVGIFFHSPAAGIGLEKMNWDTVDGSDRILDRLHVTGIRIVDLRGSPLLEHLGRILEGLLAGRDLHEGSFCDECQYKVGFLRRTWLCAYDMR